MMETFGSYEILKEFHFSASHQLNGLPESHQCARLHGHNYILKVHLGSQEIVDPGFVVDYGELAFMKAEVDALDHRHLNDIFPFNPTSENICKYYADQIVEYVARKGWTHIDLVRVALSETPKTWATYTIMVDHDA